MSDDYIYTILGSLNSIKFAALKVADRLDEKADDLADTIRSAVTGSGWLPSSRSLPPSPPPSTRLPPSSVYSRLGLWAWENRLAAGIVACTSLGLSSYIFVQRRAARARSRKRRAKRATNGARKEVIVLAGSPHDPITKSLAQDLERRGFVVFVVVNSMDDEQLVLSLGGTDIKPLNIDLLDTTGAEASVSRFEAFLNFPVTGFPGAHPHHLRLAGMILVPDFYYPTGPIEMIPADVWSDVLNLRLLSPFITAKLFIHLLRAHQSRLLVLTPSITHTLAPSFHAPETVAVAALDSFTTSLRRELRPLHVDVSQIKLGTFDISAVSGRHHLQATNGARADLVSWPSSIRSVYGRLYAVQEGKRPVKGSPLRELHHAVFDSLVSKRRLPKTVRAGSGSLVYDLIGRFAPDGVIDWMLNGGQWEEVTAARSGASEGSGSEGSVEWEKVDGAV